MRPFLAFSLLLACSSAQQEGERAAPPEAPSTSPTSPTLTTAPPLRLEAHYSVSWGYGCGGNCAQNTRGESTLVVTASGPAVEVADAGNTATTFSSPGSVTTEARTWSLAWRGTLEQSDRAMTARLTSRSSSCEESQDKGTVECKHPPPDRLVLACARDQLEVEGARRPVWRCQPDPPIPSGEWSGTPFPWVFGIDDPIDTVHAGEPRPTTRYQLRPPG